MCTSLFHDIPLLCRVADMSWLAPVRLTIQQRACYNWLGNNVSHRSCRASEPSVNPDFNNIFYSDGFSLECLLAPGLTLFGPRSRAIHKDTNPLPGRDFVTDLCTDGCALQIGAQAYRAAPLWRHRRSPGLCSKRRRLSCPVRGQSSKRDGGHLKNWHANCVSLVITLTRNHNEADYRHHQTLQAG